MCVAIKTNKCQIALYLLKHGADPNFFCKEDVPPLNEAVGRGYNDVAIQLLKDGADPNLKEPTNGGTAFLGACYKGNFEMIDYLMNHTEANIHHIDDKGRNAINYLLVQSDHLEQRKTLMRDLHARGVQVSIPQTNPVHPSLVHEAELLQARE